MQGPHHSFLSILGGQVHFFWSLPWPGQLLDPPILLSSGYQGLFTRSWNIWSMKLITHLHLVLRLRLC